MVANAVQLHWLRVGHCRHPQCMAMRGGSWRSQTFPSLCALMVHPTAGALLFDTGYAPHFMHATTPWPERLYRLCTPVTLADEDCLVPQLARLGVQPEDVSRILISHFHADHIAGLRDFPRARFMALRADWQQVKAHGRWRGVLDGWLPALLPDAFEQRLDLVDACPQRDLPAWMRPFTRAFDVLGDGSLLAVPLPGHSAGQMGLLLQHDGRPVLLSADACWSRTACAEGRLPAALTGLILHDRAAYRATFGGLQRLLQQETQLLVLPSHCEDSWQQWSQHHV